MTPLQYMHAARVPASVKPQRFGAWTLQRMPLRLIWPDYTLLRHSIRVPYDIDTMHLEDDRTEIDGTVAVNEVVMEDSEGELRKHLPIWLHARGIVLVTGLGLGCVVRGLLANPRVKHVDVVEIDADIVRIIGAEFSANPKVTIYLADAMTWEPPAGRKYDYAWHDLWTPQNDGLQVLHMKLFRRIDAFCPVQGAWAFPRMFARQMRKPPLGAPGYLTKRKATLCLSS